MDPTADRHGDEADIRAITNLVFTYPERLDEGDFEAVAALFADATYRAVTADGIVAQRGSQEVLAVMRALIKTYAGAPATKHVTTNLIVDVAEGRQRATCRSYFTVFQTIDGRIQPIVAGRYHDAFERGSDGWRFADRLIHTDLVGDVSRHLRGAVLS